MKHARRICAGVPRRVAGELHGHISKFFRFQNPSNFFNQNFMEHKIVKHFFETQPHSDLGLTFPLTFQCYISLEAFFRIVGLWKEQPKISGIFSGEDFAFIPLSGKAPRLG